LKGRTGDYGITSQGLHRKTLCYSKLRSDVESICAVAKLVYSSIIRFLSFPESFFFVQCHLLSDPTTLALPLTRSKIIAAQLAIINNFLWNDRWTFADITHTQKGWHQCCKRFLKFNMVCLAGLVLNVLVLNLVFNFLIPNRYVANLMAIAIATVWNFWVNLKLKKASNPSQISGLCSTKAIKLNWLPHPLQCLMHNNSVVLWKMGSLCYVKLSDRN
jgi:putative flippase GtrA